MKSIGFVRVLATASVVLTLAAVPASLLPAAALTLDYGTYLGGSDSDSGKSLALGSDGGIFLAGDCRSVNFPTLNPYQAFHSPDYSAFVLEISPGGSSLRFSTYLGGTGYDIGSAVALDGDGRPCLCGATSSIDFPVVNAYQAAFGGGTDAFVTCLSSSGSSLVYSTYLGGSDADFSYGLAIDSSLSLCVVGFTRSLDFPTLNPYQPSHAGGSDDAFISRFSSSGDSLTSSSYLGGSGGDRAYYLQLDASGTALVVGYSASSDFPIVNAYQASRQGGNDVFVAALPFDGSAPRYSTYLGGSLDDTGRAAAADDSGNLYLTGWTKSSDFPTLNPFCSSPRDGVDNVFVSGLTSTGSALLYSTYLGSGRGTCLALTPNGGPCVTGNTQYADFPTLNPYQASRSDWDDAFVAAFLPSGSALLYSTFAGGTDYDYGYAIAVDASGSAWVAGKTLSLDFPTAAAYQPASGGDFDAFLCRFSLPPGQTPVIDSGDYNGDGTSDIAIFRAGSGMWSVRNLTRVYFGSSTDSLVPADYDGDGTTDVAIFRESSGMWSVRNVSRFYLGMTGDMPVPGDYDGNGVAEAGLFRASAGLWAIRNLTRAYFGSSGDSVIPGCYNADDAKDIAIFRGSTGMWSVRGLTRFYFGSASDDLVPGDYNGAGNWEGGIFRPSSGLWSIRNVSRFYLGNSADQPVPADYNGNEVDDAGIFRDTAGLWAVRNFTRAYFGSAGDIPVTR